MNELALNTEALHANLATCLGVDFSCCTSSCKHPERGGRVLRLPGVDAGVEPSWNIGGDRHFSGLLRASSITSCILENIIVVASEAVFGSPVPGESCLMYFFKMLAISV